MRPDQRSGIGSPEYIFMIALVLILGMVACHFSGSNITDFVDRLLNAFFQG